MSTGVLGVFASHFILLDCTFGILPHYWIVLYFKCLLDLFRHVKTFNFIVTRWQFHKMCTWNLFVTCARWSHLPGVNQFIRGRLYTIHLNCHFIELMLSFVLSNLVGTTQINLFKYLHIWDMSVKISTLCLIWGCFVQYQILLNWIRIHSIYQSIFKSNWPFSLCRYYHKSLHINLKKYFVPIPIRVCVCEIYNILDSVSQKRYRHSEECTKRQQRNTSCQTI